MDEILEKLKEIVSQTLPEIDVSDVTYNTSLRYDLGLDSISTIMIGIAIEDEFGLMFPLEFSFESVGEICDFLEKNIDLEA